MKSWSIARARAWLFAILFLTTFLFVRIYWSSPVFNIPSPADDTGYLAYSQSILKGHLFDWCHPAVTEANLKGQCENNRKNGSKDKVYNMYTPGPAIALLPVTLLGHILDQTQIFRPAKLEDPIVFWSIVGTFLLFALGSFFLFECTLYWLKDIRRAWWMTICFVVGNPLVYFVMRRPLMSHAVEYFLFFSEIYLLIKIYHSKKPIVPSFFLGLSAGLMLITRLNNIHIPAFIGILLLFWPGAEWARDRTTKVLGYIAGCIPFLVVFLWINYLQKGTFLYSTQSYYEAYTIGFFLKLYAVNPMRVLLWFFGPHWGLVWLVPLSAYSFFYFFKNRRDLWNFVKGSRLIPLSLIAIVFCLHLNMMANGPTAMSYAYRYIFTYYFLLHIGFLMALARYGVPSSEKTRTGFSRKLQALLLASMLISSAHIINYETRVPSLRPQFPLVPVSAEWIYHPYWRDMLTWTTPYFAFYSYAHMLRGNPIMALAASPLGAFPVMALADTPLAKLPGMRQAVDYFRSDMRKIYTLDDLTLTYQFELLFGIAAAFAFLITRGRRRLEPDPPQQ